MRDPTLLSRMSREGGACYSYIKVSTEVAVEWMFFFAGGSLKFLATLLLYLQLLCMVLKLWYTVLNQEVGEHIF